MASLPPLPRPLILASTSIYRRELLQRLRLPFSVVSPGVDETPHLHEAPAELALRLACAKARAVAQQHPGSIVIGSDQVATIEGVLNADGGLNTIGKPGDFAGALAQLKAMQGKDILFHTALAIDDGTTVLTEVVDTRCRLRDLSDRALTAYLLAATPYDTAGSAKAEALGIALMARIDSDDPTALIGLPLIATTRLLARFGLDPLEHLSAVAPGAPAAALNPEATAVATAASSPDAAASLIPPFGATP